jgi:lipopolysaccharide transport protein LptA
MGSAKFQVKHFFRFISAALLLVVLVAIAVSFVTHSKRQVRIPQVSKKIEEQKIDKKEKAELIEFEGEKANFLGKADRHYIGEDGFYHMQGNVEITFFDRSEGEDILLRGQEIVHDQQWTHFWLKGQATIKFKDLTVESSLLEYDAQKRFFWTDKGIRFLSLKISGTAQECRYVLKGKRVLLRRDVHLEFRPSQEMTHPLVIEARLFEYFVGKGQGKAEGGVELFHGKSHSSAGLIEFELSASREQIKSLLLKEKVKITLRDEFHKNDPFTDQDALPLYGETCEIEAEEISIRGFVDLPQIQKLEASGGSSFKFISDSGSFTHLVGEELEFILNQGGKLRKLSVRGQARITEDDKERGYPRYIEGQSLSIQGETDVLNVQGKDVLKARIRSQDSEVSAQDISLFLKSNDFEAKEDVEVVFYPSKTSDRAIGFFSKENLVFIIADDVRYSEKQNRFLFSGEVKLWQTIETVMTRLLRLDVERGTIRARGGIKSILPYQPKGKQEEEKLSIEAEEMDFDPEKNLIIYRNKVVLREKNMNLSAQTLLIALEKEGGKIKTMNAQKDVVIVQGNYEGRGEKARYDLENEILTVVGNPVLTDKDKGKIEGSKLTFYMADGRIVIENEDSERSETVIKS